MLFFYFSQYLLNIFSIFLARVLKYKKWVRWWVSQVISAVVTQWYCVGRISNINWNRAGIRTFLYIGSDMRRLCVQVSREIRRAEAFRPIAHGRCQFECPKRDTLVGNDRHALLMSIYHAALRAGIWVQVSMAIGVTKLSKYL